MSKCCIYCVLHVYVGGDGVQVHLYTHMVPCEVIWPFTIPLLNFKLCPNWQNNSLDLHRAWHCLDFIPQIEVLVCLIFYLRYHLWYLKYDGLSSESHIELRGDTV